MKVPVCDMCRAQNGGGVMTAATATRTLTVEGVTSEIDLCETHDAKWYGPLVELVRKIGTVIHDVTPEAIERRRQNAAAVLDHGIEPKPVDDSPGFEPPRNYERHPDEPESPRKPGPKARPANEDPPHMPARRHDGRLPCQKSGCTVGSASPNAFTEHMRRAHPVWYYSDDARQWRPAGPRGEVVLCRVCETPAVGNAGRLVHERTAHPREHKALEAAKAAKPGPPK